LAISAIRSAGASSERQCPTANWPIGCQARGPKQKQLTSSKQSWDNIVTSVVSLGIVLGLNDFTVMVRWDSTHVVMDSGKHRNGFLGNIDTSKDGSGLTDTRQTLVQEIRGKMIQMEVELK
jgi:hypothetical protein